MAEDICGDSDEPIHMNHHLGAINTKWKCSYGLFKQFYNAILGLYDIYVQYILYYNINTYSNILYTYIYNNVE